MQRVLREIAEANQECHDLAMKVMDENIREVERKKSLRSSSRSEKRDPNSEKIEEPKPERKIRRKKSSRKYKDHERPRYGQGES